MQKTNARSCWLKTIWLGFLQVVSKSDTSTKAKDPFLLPSASLNLGKVGAVADQRTVGILCRA